MKISLGDSIEIVALENGNADVLCKYLYFSNYVGISCVKEIPNYINVIFKELMFVWLIALMIKIITIGLLTFLCLLLKCLL